MSKITYAALREIETTGYLKVGTDISADGTDDSFNSVSTDLSGLLDNQWLNVSGFTEAANNGWFQANGNSVAAKIIQDTSAALVTEAAGDTVTLRGYVRGYAQAYELEFFPSVLERDVKIIRKASRSLGGAMETLLQRRDVFFTLNTGPILEAALAQWREFIASVEGGEVFTFDPDGLPGIPDVPFSAVLDSARYEEDRLSTTGHYSIELVIRAT